MCLRGHGWQHVVHLALLVRCHVRKTRRVPSTKKSAFRTDVSYFLRPGHRPDLM